MRFQTKKRLKNNSKEKSLKLSRMWRLFMSIKLSKKTPDFWLMKKKMPKTNIISWKKIRILTSWISKIKDNHMEHKYIILTVFNNLTWSHSLHKINKLLLPSDQQHLSFFWPSGSKKIPIRFNNFVVNN